MRAKLGLSHDLCNMVRKNNAGDINWSGIVLGIDVMFPKPGDGAMLGVRANPNCCGRLITGEDLLPGLCTPPWQML